jgi:hypothetical protein
LLFQRRTELRQFSKPLGGQSIDRLVGTAPPLCTADQMAVDFQQVYTACGCKAECREHWHRVPRGELRNPNYRHAVKSAPLGNLGVGQAKVSVNPLPVSTMKRLGSANKGRKQVETGH